MDKGEWQRGEAVTLVIALLLCPGRVTGRVTAPRHVKGALTRRGTYGDVVGARAANGEKGKLLSITPLIEAMRDAFLATIALLACQILFVLVWVCGCIHEYKCTYTHVHMLHYA